MRRFHWLVLIGAGLGSSAALEASAQFPNSPRAPYGPSPAFAAPGFYGTSYGHASYGSVRTYSAFSSPYGAGFGYGYAPSGFIPGPYGVGLWRPGFPVPGYAYSSGLYNTYPAPYISGAPINPVPIGLYAPGFGPPIVTGR